MSDLNTCEKIDTPQSSATAQTSSRRRSWRRFVAPLMGLSIALHGALLFVPFPAAEGPAGAEDQDEPPPPEDEPIDILSLADVSLPEPPPEPSPEVEPPATASPPPPDAVPPVPDPTQTPEPLAPEEEFEPEKVFEEELPSAVMAPEAALGNSFDPARQQALLGQTGSINVEFDDTEHFPANVWDLGYLDDWGPEKTRCFFSQIDGTSYQLPPAAQTLKFFTRNYAFVVQQDLPATFPGQDLLEDPNGYCGEQFFEVQEEGSAVMYVSALKVGLGEPPGSIVLIFWTDDPRLG